MAIALAAAGCGDDTGAGGEADTGASTDSVSGVDAASDVGGSDPDAADGAPDAEPDGSSEVGSPDGDAAGDEDLSVPGLQSCDLYCALVTSACTGGNAQYATEAACLEYCTSVSPWSLGTPEDSSDNTLGCRIYQATKAGSADPELHCPLAGPTGGGVCGAWCESYCDLLEVACTGGNAQYSSYADCRGYCLVGAVWEGGSPGESANNTISCRMYHAALAASGAGDAQAQCSYAGPMGGDTCGTWCDNYCALAGRACTDDNALYADDLECQATCATFADDGTPGDHDGDTVQCRFTRLGPATNDPATHCASAAADSEQCVDDEEAGVTYGGRGGAKAVFEARCTPCHAGATPEGCSGGSCLATFYEATQLPALSCAGGTIGACALERMINQTMPPTPVKATPEEIETIQLWVDDGQLP